MLRRDDLLSSINLDYNFNCLLLNKNMELTAPQLLGFPDHSPTIKTLDLLHTPTNEICPIHYHVLSNKHHLSKTLSG